MRKRLAALLSCSVLAANVSFVCASAESGASLTGDAPAARSTVTATEVLTESTQTADIPDVLPQRQYESGIVYRTFSSGNGFAFSLNSFSAPQKIEGNGIGLRLYNGCGKSVKLKLGIGAGAEPNGSDAVVFQTLSSNGKNKNIAVYDDSKRTFLESRSGIVEIPAYFDGVLYMPYERFGKTPSGYISNFRFGCALCDVDQSYVVLYELFDAEITEGKEDSGALNYYKYSVKHVKSYAVASEMKREDDIFWGGYSFEQGTEEKRKFDKSATEISIEDISRIEIAEYQETWIGDVKLLEGFEGISADSNGDSLKSEYVVSGAPARLFPAEFGSDYGLGITLGNYATEYNGANFANLVLAGKTSGWRNWQKARGITLKVKNFQSKFINFNVEFFGVEPTGANFRWCVSFVGSRMYAYDTSTGEEWAFISNTRIYLPPDFEGWIRIPFSQFMPNAGVEAFSNEFNLDYAVSGAYINSSIKDNSDASFAIDNFGLYYADFNPASIFENTKSIKDCLKIKDYKEKYL